MALELGEALLIGKVTDDLAETAIRGLTAGAARYIGIESSVAFLFLQRGRDIRLPEGTQIEVVLMWNHSPEARPGPGSGKQRSGKPDFPTAALRGDSGRGK